MSRRSRWLGKAEELASRAARKLGGESFPRDLGSRGQELEGAPRQNLSRSMRRAQGKADRLIGSLKEAFGRALGKKRFVIEGKHQKLKGKLIEQTNR